MMSLPAMTNQSASHRGIANQIDTTTRFCNAQVIKNMSGAERWTPSVGQLIDAAKWNLLHYISVRKRSRR